MSPSTSNASNNSTDVVIVGAGPTGLMAAALLARCGVRVRLFEKNTGPAHESRAFGIQAKSMELFLNMGLAQKFLERGIVVTGAQIFVDGTKAAELNFDDIGRADTPYSFLLMVPQSQIEEVLAEDATAHGVEIEYGHEVISFEQSDGQVFTKVRATGSTDDAGTSSIQSSFIIGADGAHSMVRKTLGLTYAGAPYPQGFFLADCKIDWDLDYEHLKLFLHEQNFAVYLPLRGSEMCRIICVRPLDDPGTAESAEGNTAEPLELAEVEAAFRKAANVDVKLHDPGWLARYRIHHRGVNHYREGSAFVAGDAAHIHSPAGGQGMNTGLQDVANLAWKIAMSLNGHGDSALLDTYHDERWPVGQKVLEYTDKLFANMTTQSTWKSNIRNFMVPLVAGTISKFGIARATAFHFISQLGIHYHGGKFLHDAISLDAPHEYAKEGLTPGHRAPNALITRDIDVFSLAQGYAFHLFVFSIKALEQEEITKIDKELKDLPADLGLPLKKHFVTNSLLGEDPRIIRVESSQVFHAYGVTHDMPQALYLVRPDGYISFRSNRLAFSALREFLTDCFF